jgi:hypothetical protein
MLNAAQPTCLLIADISGYTGYLADVELDHAQDILADLIGAVVTSLRPGFRLAKLEGDAAFTFAITEHVDGSMLLDTIERCYFGFRRRRRDVRQATSCECNACVRIPDLNLKFVVHHGPVVLQKVAGRQELLGSTVIVAHRLLKNEVVERLGIGAYALISKACLDASDIDPAALGMVATTETYDRIGEVPAWVHDLERRWQEEEARERFFVTPEQSILTVSLPTSAPPQLAWAFVTAPGQRTSWQLGVTDVVVTGATGGRRGPGATNHCMHGKDAVLEEILDWRPYDYVTVRSAIPTPAGLLTMVSTTELEPTPDGATIHYRFAPPKTKRELEIAQQVGPPYREMLLASRLELVARIEASMAAGEADLAPEPALARPRPDGALAALGPIRIIE